MYKLRNTGLKNRELWEIQNVEVQCSFIDTTILESINLLN